MGKQKKRYIKRILCGVLSIAMILTGSSFSAVTAYAAPAYEIQTAESGDNGGQNVETPENQGGGLEDGSDNADNGKEEGTGESADNGSDVSIDDGTDSEDGAGDAGENESTDSDEAGKNSDAEDGVDDSDEADSDKGSVSSDSMEDAEKDNAADKKNRVDKNNKADEQDLEEKAEEMLLTMAARTYGTLQNGDFEDCGTDGNKTWANNWTVTEGPWIEDKGATGTDSKYLYCNLNWADSLEMTAYQPIDNAEPGIYVASVDAGGTYSADSFQLLVTAGENVYDWDAAEKPSQYTDKLVSVGLGKGKGNSQWGTPATYLTDAFEVTSDKSNLIVTLTGMITRDQLIYLDNVKLEKAAYDYSALQSLVTMAGEKEETMYTPESWTIFQTKLSAAKAVTNAATDVEIATAYTALEKALKELALADSSELNFYYYAVPDEGETEAFELGVELWNGANGHSVTTSETEKASWNEQYYKMQPVTGYANWYQIPLAVVDEIVNNGTEDSSDTGFAIYKKPTNGTAVQLDQFSGWSSGNPTIYAMLLAEDAKACAVKNGKGYVDNATDKLATAIMRNVTLHVYSADGTPYLRMGNAVESTLSKVNEETGGLEPLTPAAEQVDSQTAYALEQEEGSDWYSITFTAPGSFTFKKDEQICNLYYGNTYNASFMNGSRTGETWGTDFTPVFAGKVYYKDGEFFAEKPDVPTSDEKMFYFHCMPDKGETEAFELGVELWNGANGHSITTSEIEKASWNEQYYKMKTVEGYADWYQIPLTVVDEISNKGTEDGSDVGFAVYKKSADKEATEIAKFSGWSSGNPTIYAMLLAEDTKACAVKNQKGYVNNGSQKDATAILRNITLYAYNAEITPAIQLDSKSPSKTLSAVNEETGNVEELTPSGQDGTSNVYEMKPVDGKKNWYSLSFSVPGDIALDGGKKCCNLYQKDSAGAYTWVIDLYNGPVSNGWEFDISPVFSGKNWLVFSGKGAESFKGALYASQEEAEAAGKITLEQLKELIAQAKELKEEDYSKGWDVFQKALAAAEAVLQAAEDAKADATKVAPTDEEIEKAYKDLKAAKDALVDKNAVDSTVNVEKIALTDDFITGADLSSYVSLRESGTVFKDEDGNPLSDAEFFRYLHDGGTNWVRIRIWNNPYDGSGRGYGGGNNDLEKAKTIGKLASDAGMKVLIDFHYSDFWADPGKQQAPKAWKAYSLDEKVAAVESYTLTSLNALKAAGVNVGMVQVGNETNNAICGETTRENMAKIFNAGSKAVRAFDPECLVALHFTNPEKGGYQGGWAADLEKNQVDYDVFATSYYPFWHGTTKNLEGVLEYIAETYGKKVMVAETSWTTSWEDGDGHENTAPRTSQALNYDISLQGQADEIRDVINAVNNVNNTQPGKAIGVFYWEPAWISPYYVYDEDGNADEKLLKQNQEAWEKYGSGWAASYASEYDPDDAGKWYGGSAVDNQSWFDFDGTALATAKIYSLIRTGAVAERAISSIRFSEEENPLEVPLGGTVEYPKATAVYNYKDDDGQLHTEQKDVEWDEDEKELVNTNKVGEYVVHGTVKDGDKIYKLTLTVKVVRAVSANILKNPGMEAGLSQTDWKVSGAADCISTQEKDWKENPRTGTYAMNFWSETATEFTVSQTVTPEAGTYTFGGYIQGDGAGTEDVQYAFVEVSDGSSRSRRQAAFTLNGWRNWSNPQIADIKVNEGETVTVGVTIKATETGTNGVWGSLDDFYLYGTHDVSVAADIKYGRVETNVVKANGGEKVIVTVTPDEGYYPETLTISGNSITTENCADILTSDNGAVTFRAAADVNKKNAAVLTYTAKTAEAKSNSFTMPNGNVAISAAFKSVFDGAGKIALDAKDPLTGKYLVQVNLGESDAPDGESPIPAQFHTGKDVKPSVALSYQGYQLTTADYTVSYANNRNLTTADSKAKITLTARGEKFEGTREIVFEIKEDTRKEFSAKKLKVVFEASDKNGRTDKSAKAVYYLGKEKEIEPKISLYQSTDGIEDTSKAIDPTLYTAYYQNNKKIGKATLVVLPTDKALNDPDGYKEGSITTNFTIAKCPVNQGSVKVAVSAARNYYTGKKVEPSVTVTYTYTEQNGAEKTVKLAKGTDYTVTYANNVNASVYKTVGEDGAISYVPINANKAPTVKITGKGNFAGVRTTENLKPNGQAEGAKFTFQIMPRDLGRLGENAATAANLAESTKAQAPKITVKDGTKKVAASQYEITEIKLTHDANGNALAADQVQIIYSKGNGATTGIAKVKAAGTYEVTIAGKAKANYEGTAKAVFRVVDKDYLISNVKITVRGKLYYTGNAVKLTTTGETPNLTVKMGSVKLAEQDSAGSGQDGYYVSYANNMNAGRATVTITGTGKYVGTKTATFTINKRILAFPGTVKDNEKSKKGELQKIKLSAKSMAAKHDSTWTRFEGTDLEAMLVNSDNTAETEFGSLAIPYTGNTLNPEFKFSSSNCDVARNAVMNELSRSDYTVTYSIGKWAEGKAPVTATIKGKGNYSGSVKLQNLFTVTARNLKDFSIDVSPVIYNGKALKPAVIFRNKDTGKIVNLKLNTAYTVTYKNNINIPGVSKKQPTLTVKVKGKGWITDNADSATKSRILNFTIDQAEITKADVGNVVFQTFRGKALKPKVTVKVNGRKLKEGKDYELTYDKNMKRSGTSTATVSIRGKGNYYTRTPIVKTFVIK